MSAYVVESLDPEPILLITIGTEWDIRTHTPDFLKEWKAALEAAGGPVTTIVDVTGRDGKLPDLNDLIWGANEGARGANAVIKHPWAREIVLVSTSRVLSLAARGLRSDAFGNAQVNVFGTLDEALAHARRSVT